MPTHRVHEEKEAFYFITFTCYRWLPLLKQAKIQEYLPKWIRDLSDRKITTCGYVMMPNHLHLLVYVEKECKGLSRVIGEGKRFIAYEVISKLKAMKAVSLLDELAKRV